MVRLLCLMMCRLFQCPLGVTRRLLAVLLLVPLILSSLPSVSAATIYQWRDENGKLHFSDKKPKHQPAEDISRAVEKVNVDDSGAERAKLQRLFKPETAEEKALKQRQQQQTAQQAQRQQVQCGKARRYLEVLRGPVYFSREDGSTYDVSESERQQRVAEMEAQIRDNC